MSVHRPPVLASPGAFRRAGLTAIVLSTAVLAGSLPARAQTFLGRFDGEQAFDEAGFSVGVVGDLDLDGCDDIVVGADEASPGGRFDAGEVLVLSGRTGAVIHRVEGEQPEDFLGWSVAGAGDVDLDGVPDFVVGAPFASPGGRSWAGLVLVVSGATGATLHRLEGVFEFDRFGTAVDGAGDVNGDGHADVIVGAPFTTPLGVSEAGRVYVVSGLDGSLLFTRAGEFQGDAFGSSVAGVGDVNGDGFDDVLVGAPFYDVVGSNRIGAAYLLLGPGGIRLHRFVGTSASDEFGTSVGAAGDVDGDGIPDVVVGAPKASDAGVFRAGHAVVFSGLSGVELFRFHGRGQEDRLGISVAGIGDADGDGYDDVASGAYLADPRGLLNAGEVHVARGPDGSDVRVIESSSAGIRFGFSIAGGDLNGDLDADLVIGADEYSPPGRRGAGSVYLYTGESLLPLARRGNVNRAQGTPSNILFVNGSAGEGAGREVALGPFDPIEIFVDTPPSRPQGQTRLCLYLALGAPDDGSVRTQRLQGVLLGHTAFPTPMSDELTPIRKILSNMGHTRLLGEPDFVPPRAPAIMLSAGAGAQRQVVAVVQALIIDTATPSGLVAVSNAVTLRVE